jgi:hypothetical protein
MATLQSKQRRGWVAFGAGVFLMVLTAGIWIWIDVLLSGGAQHDSAEATFLGKLNVALGLILVAGILGTINGWGMAKTGRRNVALILFMVICFAAGLFVAVGASNGLQTQ